MPNPGRASRDVQKWTKDFKRLQQQKHRMRGGVEATMLSSLGMYYGEQYMQQARDTMLTRPLSDDDKNKLFLVFNLMKRASRRKIGRLWAASGGNRFYATPDVTDPKAYDQADVINKLIKAVGKKVRERRQHWLRLFWMVNCGVVVEHTPWIEEAGTEPMPAYDEATGEILWRDAMQPDQQFPQSVVEQQIQMGASPERFNVIETLQMVGDVGSQIVSPFNFFIDSATPSIDRLGGDQACYIVEVKTLDFVKEHFGKEAAAATQSGLGKDLGIIKTRLLDRGPAVAGLNMKDLIPSVQGSQGVGDPPMCLFATRYQPPCQDWPHGRRSMFNPNGPTYEDDDNPYGELPVTDFHFGAPATTFWTDGFLTDLIPPQKFLNKRFSQLGEAANAQLYEILLLGPELSKTDIPSDMPGVVEDGINESGAPNVAVLQRGQLPAFFPDSIRMVIEMFQTMSSADLTDQKNFAQMRGPMALPLLQEVMDSEDGPLYEHIGEQLAIVHQQRINRVKQFYPAIRTLNYTGTNRRDEVLVFQTSKILRAGVDFNISIDPGTLMPEFSALREARLIERLSGPLAGLYVNRRTGRMDFTKIAQEMRYQDDSAEDQQTQYRDLAKHLIARLWQGETLPEEVPYAFWDHDTVLDELEAAMATTEFLEASSPTKQNFIVFYEKCRQFLAAIQDAQQGAAQQAMMNGAIAQTTQQVAAKVAATTVDDALDQIKAQVVATQANPPLQSLTQAMAANGGAGAQGRLAGGPPAGRTM